MALAENPKKMAEDIAAGLRTFHKAHLRGYTAQDMKIIIEHLNTLNITIRQEVISMDDPDYMEKTKEKNRRMGRIRNTISIMRNFCHKRSIKGVF